MSATVLLNTLVEGVGSVVVEMILTTIFYLLEQTGTMVLKHLAGGGGGGER